MTSRLSQLDARIRKLERHVGSMRQPGRIEPAGDCEELPHCLLAALPDVMRTLCRLASSPDGVVARQAVASLRRLERAGIFDVLPRAGLDVPAWPSDIAPLRPWRTPGEHTHG